MSVARFASTFAIALGAHAVVALGLLLAAKRTARAPVEPVTSDMVFDLDEDPAPPAGTKSESRPGAVVDVPADALVRRPSFAARPARDHDEAPIAAVLEAQPVAPADGKTGGAGAPSAPIDLGIGSYWKTVALADNGSPLAGAPSPEPPPLPAPPSPDRILRDVLEAHDRALGLGSEGPIVSAAHEAASPAIAPDVGDAIFEADCDAMGRNITVRLVQAVMDRAQWNDVTRELERLLSTKVLRVPPGARGVRTRFQIAARRVLPSGEKLTTNRGAVPDDVPGSDPVCVDAGAARKCLEGMPVGLTQTLGDLSNIGAKRSRAVQVHVLSERTL